MTSNQQQHSSEPQPVGRRAALAAAALLPALCTARPSRAVSSDLVEGTQNVLSISRESLGLWVQKGIDSIVNDDATGITDLDNLDGSPRKRRFGEQQLQGVRAS